MMTEFRRAHQTWQLSYDCSYIGPPSAASTEQRLRKIRPDFRATPRALLCAQPAAAPAAAEIYGISAGGIGVHVAPRHHVGEQERQHVPWSCNRSTVG